MLVSVTIEGQKTWCRSYSMYTFNSTVSISFVDNNKWLCTANTGKSMSTTVWWKTRATMFMGSKISVSWTIYVRELSVLEPKFTSSMTEKQWKHVCARHLETDNVQSLHLRNGYIPTNERSPGLLMRLCLQHTIDGWILSNYFNPCLICLNSLPIAAIAAITPTYVVDIDNVQNQQSRQNALFQPTPFPPLHSNTAISAPSSAYQPRNFAPPLCIPTSLFRPPSSAYQHCNFGPLLCILTL